MSPISTIPSNPFHIARAYHLRPPVAPGPAPAVDASQPRVPSAASRLVAAVVPGRIDFSAAEPSQRGPAMPMYRHPADRNIAATRFSAGRMLDVTA